MERPNLNPVTVCVDHTQSTRTWKIKGLNVCMNNSNVCPAQWGMRYLTEPCIVQRVIHREEGLPSSYNSYTLKGVPQRSDQIKLR